MKRNPWIVATLVIAGLLIVGAVLVKFALPGYLKSELLAASKRACPDCVVYFKSVDVSLGQPGLLEFHDVRFVAGKGGRSLVEARLKDVSVDVSLMHSTREQIVIKSVDGREAEVIYAAGDASSVMQKDLLGEHRVKFAVLSTRVENALFRFVRTKEKRTAILHVHQIDGTMGPIGTTSDLIEKPVEIRLSGQVEKSGRAELTTILLLRQHPWYVDMRVFIEGQSLADLNPFLKVVEGFELGGTLIKGLVSVNVRGEQARAFADATYKDADFKLAGDLLNTSAKHAIEAVGAKFLIVKSNEAWKPIDRRTELNVAHEGDEPLMRFIFRSAKLAVVDLIKKPDSRSSK